MLSLEPRHLMIIVEADMTEQLDFNSALNTSLSPKRHLGRGSVGPVRSRSLATGQPPKNNRKRKAGLELSKVGLFGWIDNNPSESQRRVFQSIISGLSKAAILAASAVIFADRESIAQGSLWFWSVLQSPVPVWLFFLLVGLTGLASSLARKKEIK